MLKNNNGNENAVVLEGPNTWNKPSEVKVETVAEAPKPKRIRASVLTGSAIPCGSGCFQTADGSMWLGRPSPEAVSEAKRIAAALDTHSRLRSECIEFLNYCGIECRWCDEHQVLELR